MKRNEIVATLHRAMVSVNRQEAEYSLDSVLENFAVNDGKHDYSPKYVVISEEAKKVFAETWEEAENVDEFVVLMVRRLPSYFATWTLAEACKEPGEYERLVRSFVRQSCTNYFEVNSVRGELSVDSKALELTFEFGGEETKATVYVIDTPDALQFSPAYGERLCDLRGVFTVGRQGFKGEWALWRMHESRFVMIRKTED